MQKESVEQLRAIALVLVKEAHKFPEEVGTVTDYRITSYPEFSVRVQNKALNDSREYYNIWFCYDNTTQYGSFEHRICFRYSEPDRIKLMTNYVKHFNLKLVLPIFIELVEAL